MVTMVNKPVARDSSSRVGSTTMMSLQKRNMVRVNGKKTVLLHVVQHKRPGLANITCADIERKRVMRRDRAKESYAQR